MQILQIYEFFDTNVRAAVRNFIKEKIKKIFSEKMFRNPLQRLENAEIPLLGPNIHALRFWGLLLPKQSLRRYFYLLMHILVSLFTLTEWLDIWFIKSDLNLLMNNVKITMLATMSVIKVSTFIYWQDDWKSIIDYVTSSDMNQRTTTDAVKSSIISKYTKYCRKITYFYWFLMYTTVVIVMFTPIFKFFISKSYRENTSVGKQAYHQVVSSWVPFDKNTLRGHIAASVIQSYASIYGGGWITSFDTTAIVIMVFFRGELELLRRDCAGIFQPDAIAGTTDLGRLKECKKRHSDLVRFARLFDSCLSPIMFFYMFVCSVMLCVTAYEITIETSPMQRFLITEYLVFGVAQLFMYCWHSNDVLYASNELILGPFESKWWNKEAYSTRKDLLILVEQYRKPIVFTAGPFTTLNVSTFIGILRGAYSFYTLLSQSQI